MQELIVFIFILLSLFSFGIFSIINPLRVVLFLLFLRPSLDYFHSVSLYNISGIVINVNSIFLFFSILLSLVVIIKKFSSSFFNNRLHLIFIFFLLLITFYSSFFNQIGVSALPYILRWFGIYSFFIFGYHFGYHYQYADHIKKTIRIILFSSIIPILFSIIQIISGQFSFYTEMHDFERLQGTFVHPGAYGCFIAMLLSFSLPKLIFKDKNNILWVLINGVLFIFLLLSFFKTAWFGIIFALIITIVSIRRGKIPIPIFLFSISAIFLFESIITQRLGDTQSLYWRFGIWNYLLSYINNISDLLFGFGLGATKYFISFIIGTNVTTAHSTYIELLIDYGLIATLLFLFIHLISIKNAFLIIRNKNVIIKQFGVSLLLISFLFLSIYLSQTLLKPLFLIYLMYIFGISAGILDFLKTKKNNL